MQAFEDTLCQLLDLAQTNLPLTLKCLRKCGQADLFINTLLNINKYLDNEEKDPFASDPEGGKVPSAWDRFAESEYEVLAAEEDDADDNDDWSDDGGGSVVGGDSY